MTPPDHFLIGISLGNIFYGITKMFNKKYLNYFNIFILSGFSAILPDIDFAFGHYSSINPFLGHRGMTHSFFGVAVFSIIITIILLNVSQIFKGNQIKNILNIKKQHEYMEMAFCFTLCFISGVSHLLADLPQPPGIWNGIPLFFPLKDNGEFIRNGGWSFLGWYDYKIFWNLVFTVFITSIFIAAIKFIQNNKFKKIVITAVATLNILLFIWMISYIGSSQYPGPSKWENLQLKKLKDFPAPIYRATISGRSLFIRIFMKASNN